MKKMVLILLAFFMCITNIKAVTKVELQDMVVSTALSYLHNNKYTEYDQLAMDEASVIKLKDNGSTTNVSSMNWRNPNVSPEEISRTNNFSIDCSSFATIVSKYSLGYDFTDYYELNSSNYFYTFNKSTQTFSGSRVSSAIKMQTRFYQFGRGISTVFFTDLAKQDAGNNKYNPTKVGAYYYEFKTGDDLNAKYQEYIGYLQPGDIMVYRKANYGHAMVYIGEELGVAGFIHSGGADFKYNEKNKKMGNW